VLTKVVCACFIVKKLKIKQEDLEENYREVGREGTYVKIGIRDLKLLEISKANNILDMKTRQCCKLVLPRP
jgi:hypothetical protein